MSDGRSWRGNWVARLYQRVRERGYDSVTAFAEARPTATLVELAHELGQGDVAGVQVFEALVEEAERGHYITRLVRGQLVRELWRCLPDGWPVALVDPDRFKVAKALGAWTSFTPVTHRERAEQVSRAPFATSPPPGWRPRGPDDELLRMLLPDDDA